MHWSQASFIPLCVYLCLVKDVLKIVLKSHWSQPFVNPSCFPCLCVFKLSLYFAMKLQLSQLNLRPLMWLASMCLFINVPLPSNPQTLQLSSLWCPFSNILLLFPVINLTFWFTACMSRGSMNFKTTNTFS